MTPIVNIAGLTLLHFLWQGTLLTLGAAALLRLMRDASPHSRYVTACIALTAMLAAPIVTFRVLAAPAAPPVVVRSLPVNQRIGPAPLVATGSATETPERHGRPSADVIDDALPVVVGLWAAGVVILLVRLAGGWWRVRSRHQAALNVTASRWQATVEKTAALLGLRRCIRCVDSSLVDTPTVIGWLRPVILLPIAALTNLTPAQVEAILAHELAHIRRHDYVVNLLQNVTETLLFYHPGVWWLSARIRAEREHCCDEIAVSMHGDALAYVAALAELESWRSKSPSLAVAATGGSLLERVQRVLRLQDDRYAPASNAILPAALILLIVVAGGSRYVPAHADNRASMVVQAAPLPTWQTRETAHFDVLYGEGAKAAVDAIARDAERAYDRIWSGLGHDLSYKPYVVLFGTRGELERGLSARAFPQDRQHILVSLEAQEYLRSGGLAHEVTHAFVADILSPAARATLPSWLSEGLAEHMRGEWSEPDREAMRDLVRRNAVPDVSRLTAASFPDSPRVNYWIGHAAFDYIVSEWNTEGVRKLLLSLNRNGASGNLEAVLRSAFGLEAGAFDRDFERYVSVRFGEPADSLRAPLANLRHKAEELREELARLRSTQPARPAKADPMFGLASIKRNSSGDRRVLIRPTPEGVAVVNATVKLLIQNAYRVQEFVIVDAPDWIDSDRFDIVTKADDTPTAQNVADVMQALLRDRFNLKVRRETRDLPVYTLTTESSDGAVPAGLRVSGAGCATLRVLPLPPPMPGQRPQCGFSVMPSSITANGVTLREFATPLSRVVQRVVLDRTRLDGEYDFEVQWTPDVPIFGALQEQLGLKLELQTAPVDVLVIERIGQPLEE